MLLSGCWAVSVLPAVWAWKRSCWARGSVAPNWSRMMRAHMRRAARNFGDLLQKVVVSAEEEREALAERIGVEARVDRRLHVRHAVRERERDLLRGGGACFADVVPADRRSGSIVASPARRTRSRRSRCASRAAAGRCTCRGATYSLRMSFCTVPDSEASATPCRLATAPYSASRMMAVALMVIELDTRSRGIPSKSAAMSSIESIATPTRPTSPAASGWSES